MHVAGELNRRTLMFFLHRFHVAMRLWMIAATNHKFRVG